MRILAAVVLALAGCGGSPPLDLLGKPCTSNGDCAPIEGVLCSPIWLGEPAEYACELPASGTCPAGTKPWRALLTIPDASGAYQTADYCAPQCQVLNPSDQVGTCRWNRQCVGLCGR